MAISNSNERLVAVVDKNIKRKLEVICERRNISVSAYVSAILEEHIVEYEKIMLDEFPNEFDGLYQAMFDDLKPHPRTLARQGKLEKSEILMLDMLARISDTNRRKVRKKDIGENTEK